MQTSSPSGKSRPFSTGQVRLLLWGLLLATAALLTACGGGGDEPAAACYVDGIRQRDGSVMLAPHNCPPGTVPTVGNVVIPRADCGAQPLGCQ